VVGTSQITQDSLLALKHEQRLACTRWFKLGFCVKGLGFRDQGKAATFVRGSVFVLCE
jgi:hypothetical protein